MQHEEILTTISGTNRASCLEVAFCTDSLGGRKLELRRLSWGEGVGWYCQQTLRLDPSESEELLWALKGNRYRWRDRPASGGGKVIPFPVLSAPQGDLRVQPVRKAAKTSTGNSSAELPVAAKRGTKRGEEKSATSRV
jgi:hypothetical protein